MTVERLPTAGLPAHLIEPNEIWAQEEPTDLMVWAVCPYLTGDDRCKGCPRWEDGAHGTVQRLCYGLAAEVCRVVAAAAARPTADGKGDAG